MDQELKQRLIGAAVITALAAIFVPMLFDDPIDESGKSINELKIPELPAKAQDVDMVLEKVLTLDSEGTGPGSRWPIVHFAKPEFEITDEIAERLNSRYRKAP